MKKFLYTFLNDIMVGTAFTISTCICQENTFFGLLCYIVSYFLLKLHCEFYNKINNIEE